MDIIYKIQSEVKQALGEVYTHEADASSVLVNVTKKDFTGDYTVVIFPFVKALRKSPIDIGTEIGTWLKEHVEEIIEFNCIQGFLNLSLSDQFWVDQTIDLIQHPDYWKKPANGKKIIVEFSSPNTNKPLHLGHIRNILLGWSCSQMYEAIGYDVIKTQIINDRGIAVCKSMLAWQKFADGQTPEMAKMKSDHFVGDWYVRFDIELQKEYQLWQKSEIAGETFESLKKEDETSEIFFKRFKNEYFNQFSALGQEAREMLMRWEASDPETRALWEQMNGWVYKGFDSTYEALGVSFDKLYYESNTYLLGKDLIEKGLSVGTFFKKDDGSVWVNLEDEGMDEKILLRADGTSVYMTQDLGTADLRYRDYGAEKMIYVVGDEQNYHFKALFTIMKKLGASYADGLHHLSYGMIDLPTGRMKSREGTVVDADDLIEDVINEARKGISERGEIVDLDSHEKEEIIRRIGIAALKFFMIKIDPKKRMIFDPQASVDLQGQTGPYIQNAFVRIQSILRKANKNEEQIDNAYQINEDEKSLLVELCSFPYLVENAAHQLDPSSVANFCYNLAKEFHRYYHEHRILKAESEAAHVYRLNFIKLIAEVLENGMNLLGIEMPDRM